MPEWVKARNKVANEEGEEEEETWLVGARLLNKGVSKKADKVAMAQITSSAVPEQKGKQSC